MRHWRAAVGAALSLTLLWWALRGVELSQVWRVLQGARTTYLALAALLATASFPIRALRWRYILHGAVPAAPYGALWRATAVGMMLNNLLPARAGEIARALMAARDVPRLPLSAALASLVVDRLFDLLAVLGLLAVAVASSQFPVQATVAGRPLGEWTGLFWALASCGFAVLLFVALFPRLTLLAWDRGVGSVAPLAARRAREIVQNFTSGLTILRHPPQAAAVLLLTFLQWLVSGASFWIGFRAFDIQAPFSTALFLQSLVTLGVALPAAPGFFGSFEAFAVAALGIYGIDANLSMSYAIGYHLFTFLPITAIGLWHLWHMGLRIRDVTGSAPEARRP